MKEPWIKYGIELKLCEFKELLDDPPSFLLRRRRLCQQPPIENSSLIQGTGTLIRRGYKPLNHQTSESIVAGVLSTLENAKQGEWSIDADEPFEAVTIVSHSEGETPLTKLLASRSGVLNAVFDNVFNALKKDRRQLILTASISPPNAPSPSSTHQAAGEEMSDCSSPGTAMPGTITQPPEGTSSGRPMTLPRSHPRAGGRVVLVPTPSHADLRLGRRLHAEGAAHVYTDRRPVLQRHPEHALVPLYTSKLSAAEIVSLYASHYAGRETRAGAEERAGAGGRVREHGWIVGGGQGAATQCPQVGVVAFFFVVMVLTLMWMVYAEWFYAFKSNKRLGLQPGYPTTQNLSVYLQNFVESGS
ncbi:hypothetical protein BU15DRAFT_81766 [Melanogaster broomeanus]|nr:hypothetical protein BU15DRAFT_81766 [Melanogaster broomeanus]